MNLFFIASISSLCILLYNFALDLFFKLLDFWRYFILFFRRWRDVPYWNDHVRGAHYNAKHTSLFSFLLCCQFLTRWINFCYVNSRNSIIFSCCLRYLRIVKLEQTPRGPSFKIWSMLADKIYSLSLSHLTFLFVRKEIVLL